MDGAFAKQSAEGGIGVLIRNEYSKVLLSSWRIIYHASDAEEVEALACKEGFALAAEWIDRPVLSESDCMSVTQLLMHQANNRPRIHFILQEAWEFVGWCPDFAVRHVKRAEFCCPCARTIS